MAVLAVGRAFLYGWSRRGSYDDGGGLLGCSHPSLYCPGNCGSGETTADAQLSRWSMDYLPRRYQVIADHPTIGTGEGLGVAFPYS